MTELYQFTLDCAATFTNELDRLTRLSFLPWNSVGDAQRKAAEARIDKGCTRQPAPPAAAPPAPGAPLPGLAANPPASPAPSATTLAPTPAPPATSK